MTTLPNRPNTALLIVDVQNDVVKAAHERDAVVANIARLVDKARSSRTTIVWVQHVSEKLVHETKGWEIVPELKPQAPEPVVQKTWGDAFEETDLESVLMKGDIGHLVVAGAQTDACIRATIHGAFTRGYDVTLVTDAHTTEDFTAYGAPPPQDVIAHTNLYWKYETAPGRKADALPTNDVKFDR
jgi:nicotinamidase-related amidase